MVTLRRDGLVGLASLSALLGGAFAQDAADCVPRSAIDAYVAATHERRLSIWAATSQPESGATVFLGSSIVEEGPWEALFPSLVTINRGSAADTTLGVGARLDDVIALRPRAVVLYVGGNDLSILGDEPGAAAARTVALLDRLRAELPDADLYVHALFAREARYAGGVAAFNEALRDTVPKHTTFLDFHDLFATEAGAMDPRWSNDGIHLLGEAYLLWAKALRPYLTD